MSSFEPHTAPLLNGTSTTALPSSAPEWARVLYEEQRRTRLEVEALRRAIAVHVVSRKQAAVMLGCVPKTVARYEKRNLIEPARIDRPGVQYLHATASFTTSTAARRASGSRSAR